MQIDGFDFTQKTIPFLFLFLILINITAYALPFSIVPKTGTILPTSVHTGSTVTAYYTVYNNTPSPRKDNFVKYLPPNVSQVTTGGTFDDTCGITFSLAAIGQPGYHCTLQLTVSGPVDSNDPFPANHLFVCFPGGKLCAGTNYPLHVTQTSEILLTAIAITPTLANLGILETQQYTAIGTYTDNSTADITASVTWNTSAPHYATISSTGLATGIAPGTTQITANQDSIISNMATLSIGTPVAVTLTSPDSAAFNVGVGSSIVITFSGAVQPNTVTTESFKVGSSAGSANITGNIVMNNDNTVATYIPTAALPLNAVIYVTLTSHILDSFGRAITPYAFTFTTQPEYLIYASAFRNNLNGNLGGIAGADAICQASTTCPIGATCKAMLASNHRSALPTPIDWVLQSSTAYYNTDNNLIGITTDQAIFDFNLINAFAPSAGGLPWTGLSPDWTNNSNNCSNWTENSGKNSGQIGNLVSITSTSISHTSTFCIIAAHVLYCVQQP